MSEITAKWGEMRRDSDEIKRIKRKISQLKEKINSVKVIVNHMDCLGNYSDVRNALENNIDDLDKQRDSTELMSNVLESIATEYHRTEQELINANDISEKEKIKKTINAIIDALSAGNIPASLKPYVKMLLNGEADASDLAEALLAAPASMFAFFADAAEKLAEDGDWKEILKDGFSGGTYMPEGTEAGKTFAEYLKIALKKEGDEFVDVSNVANGAGAVAKWAGVLTEGIGEIIDNYGEYDSGEISAGRAVAETVIETGVGVTVGIGVSAIVGAGLAAIGFVAAPAVAVGAISALVVGGTNFILEKTTGKDMGEWVSDFFCDIGESIGKWAMG